MNQAQLSPLRVRFRIKEEILQYITKIWEMGSRYTLGFIEDKNDLTSVELRLLLHAVRVDYSLIQ